MGRKVAYFVLSQTFHTQAKENTLLKSVDDYYGNKSLKGLLWRSWVKKKIF